MDDIETAFHPVYKNVILLYESEIGMGHWVCLFRNGNIIEHFDSYGLKPDMEMEFIPKNFKNKYYGKSRHLAKLLLNSGRKIRYNQYKFQKEFPMATCGRHCACRLMLRDLSIKQYHRLIGIKNADLFVTFLTMFLEAQI